MSKYIYIRCRKDACTELDPDEPFDKQVHEFIQAEADGALFFDMEWVFTDENGEEISEEEARAIIDGGDLK